MEKNKFKNLRYDLLIIIVSFILVTGGGSIITYFWQNKELKNQLLMEQKKFEKDAATKLFEEISKQLDRQVSNFQFLINDQSYKQKCKEDYLTWNENKTRLKALAEKYFGDSASLSITYFSDQFKTLFMDLIIGSASVDSTSLGTNVNKLEIEIFNFNSQLIDALLQENFGSHREKQEKQ